jgi:uncharacterized membrane protein
VFAAVHSNRPAALSPTEVVGCIVTGPERTFDQDPALAIRVLVDIALRALSPAVNDPTTAAQALDVLGELVDAVSPARRAPVERRLKRATSDLQQAFPDEARAAP